jgi:uncharacterized protein YqgC (DUF456 family)
MMQHLPELAMWIVCIACIIVGFIGTVIPALPGPPLIFLGIALVGWWYEFSLVGVPTLIVTGALAVLALVIDSMASVLGAKKVGATRAAIVGSTIGALVGMFFFLPGIILGPFIGAVLGELYAEKGWEQATKVGIGTWLGLLAGTAAKIALSLAMLGVFLLALL